MVNKGRIRMLFNSRLASIEQDSVTVETDGRQYKVDNDFVLAMTGFRPNRSFLEKIGVKLEGDYLIPEHDPETMQTNVEGLYIAGVISSGANANEIFIETGRKHGLWIAQHIMARKSLV